MAGPKCAHYLEGNSVVHTGIAQWTSEEDNILQVLTAICERLILWARPICAAE